MIIVGAGPAGGLLGYLLSRRNLNVLIIDKKKFPRHKPCGGGLTRRALSLLPFSIDSVVEDRTLSAVVTMNGRPLFEKTTAVPMITMVRRDRFDALIVDEARGAGATFKDQTAFGAVTLTKGTLQVESTRGRYAAQVLVGADGINSRVAKALGRKMHSRRMYAIEAQARPREAQQMARYRGKVQFDFGIVPQGYGWIFPKRDHLSVGVFTQAPKPRWMNLAFDAYLKRKNLRGTFELLRIRGYPIPFGNGKRAVFADAGGWLIGDAAGMTDPITGEGIYYALRQAQMAAEAIEDYFNERNSSLDRFNRRMRQEFVADLTSAGRLSAFFYRYPGLSRSLIGLKGRFLGESFLEVVSGNRQYREVFAFSRLIRKGFNLSSSR